MVPPVNNCQWSVVTRRHYQVPILPLRYHGSLSLQQKNLAIDRILTFYELYNSNNEHANHQLVWKVCGDLRVVNWCTSFAKIQSQANFSELPIYKSQVRIYKLRIIMNKYVCFKIGCFFMSSLTNFALSIPNKTKTHMITIKVAAVHFMEFPGFFN